MKVLLINPPANIIEERSEIKICSIPLGLAYIAAVLEQRGHEVRILDVLLGEGYLYESKRRDGFIRYGLSQKEIEDRIRDFGPAVVGISGLHSNRIFEIRETTQAAKNVSKDIVTIVGGGFASLNPMECLSDPHCDIIVMGEGEDTILDLLSCIDSGGDLAGVKGIGFKKGENHVASPSRKPIGQLDSIPAPAYHLLDMEGYFSIEMRGSRYGKKRYALFCGSRGCPHSCHYCPKSLIAGEGYRVRSIESMINEILFLKRTYDIEELRFVDYHATANVPRWKDFCKALIRQKLGIALTDPHGVAVSTLDDEMLDLMREAGFERLYISIESSDQEHLDRMNKKLDLGMVGGVITKARELGYHITGYFLIGLPGQGWEGIHQTVAYAKELDLDDVDFFIANPFPGTELYDYCARNDLLSSSFHPSRLRYSLSNLKNPEYTAEELEAFRKKAWFDFSLVKRMKRRATNSDSRKHANQT
jgi:radical SAM superfamily enzyme YgiQ (UPF0313 family)